MGAGEGKRRMGSVTLDDKSVCENDGEITTVEGDEVTEVMTGMTDGGGTDGKVGGWEVVGEDGSMESGCRETGVDEEGNCDLALAMEGEVR